MTWHQAVPQSPAIGDCYFDTDTGESFVYDGTAWMLLASSTTPVQGQDVAVVMTEPKQWEPKPVVRK